MYAATLTSGHSAFSSVSNQQQKNNLILKLAEWNFCYMFMFMYKFNCAQHTGA